MAWQDYTQIQLGDPAIYPFFFSTLFGNGQDGELTLVTNSDVGYLGAYGSKQATNATLASDQTLTIAQGTSSGALIIGCTGKLTIAGTIIGDGAAGGNGSGGGGGIGGATAGGGLGNSNPTKIGHGAGSVGSAMLGRGGATGGFNAVSSTSPGGNAYLPGLYSSQVYPQQRVINSNTASGPIRCEPGQVAAMIGAASANGTTAAAYPTAADIGPWAQIGTGVLPLGFIPGGQGGFGGGATAGGGNNGAGGGGGGGGGVVIFEADTIELVSGYAIYLRGGAGGNGFTGGALAAGMAGSPGGGGLVFLVCRKLIGSTSAINCNAGAAGTGSGTQVAGIAGGVVVIKV